MKKSTRKLDAAEMKNTKTTGATVTDAPSVFVGIDVGDRKSHFCILDAVSGETVRDGTLATTESGLRRLLRQLSSACVAIEVGTHSAWISRQVSKLGHKIIVANARKLRVIYQSDKKNDKLDALMLARIARLDPELLSPIQHRGGQAQADLAVLRARDELVKARTQLINSVRGTMKSFGFRLPSCSAERFHKIEEAAIPSYLRVALVPLREQIAEITARIRDYDRRIQELATRYPEVKQLQQVGGVGPLTSLSFILTIENPWRFKNARVVGAYLGMCPRLDDSGDSRSQLGITKAGDANLRRLLTQCAQYILGPFGKDCELRRHGERISQRGGKNAKKRAVTAVARKLSVLLCALWRNGTSYEPIRLPKEDVTSRSTARIANSPPEPVSA